MVLEPQETKKMSQGQAPLGIPYAQVEHVKAKPGWALSELL